MTSTYMLTWLELMVLSPIVCFRDPHLLHALTMDGIGEMIPVDPPVFVAACGKPVDTLMLADDGPVCWPPRVASLPDGVSRCRECHKATGSKRPVSTWKAKEEHNNE